MKKTTIELLQILKNTTDYSSYEAKYGEQLLEQVPIDVYLSSLLAEKQLSKSVIIRRSGLDRGYAYDIFSGKKHPARDKVLALCFGASLSIDETQKLLKTTGYPPLYARIARDNIILFSLERKFTIIDTNMLLEEMDMELLT